MQWVHHRKHCLSITTVKARKVKFILCLTKYHHDSGGVIIDGVRIGEWIYCPHHSELQVITALSLISTIYKSPQHPLSIFSRPLFLISRSLATASNSRDSWASRAHGLSSQPSVQNSTDNWRRNLVTSIVFKITPRHGPRRKHRFQVLPNSSIIPCWEHALSGHWLPLEITQENKRQFLSARKPDE
jgi:hypothetical protein